MTFPSNIQSNTPAKYLFKLITDTEEVICDIEPIEWASGLIRIKRDLEVGGVFISSNSESLTFVGNGAELLRNLYDTYGLNAKCTLVHYWWKEFDFVTPANGRRYVEFPERYNIDFNFYQTVKVGSFSFGIKVKAINSSIQTKFDQRQDIDVDLNKLVSIGETAITDYSALKKIINYTATNIYNYAELTTNTPVDQYITENTPPQYIFDLPRVSGTNCYATIPLIIVKNDFYGEILPTTFANRILNIVNADKLLSNSQFDRTFIFKYYLRFSVIDKHVGTPPWTVQLITSNAAETTFVETEIGTFGNDIGSVVFDDSISIDVKEGENVRLVVKTGDISGIKALYIRGDVTFTQEVAASPARAAEGFPIYEAFERVCQHIFDNQYPFYSAFFGRTGLVYDSSGNAYGSENQLRFAHIQSGLNLRGLSLSNITLPINFKDLFKTSNAIWNLGYGFETVSGTTRLRVEEYSHFFQDSEIVLSPTLSSRINKYDIESQVMIEFAPNDIKSGFSKYEYLQINGRGEPNTTSQRTSILNTATKFNNVAVYRGDTKGILASLNTPIDTTDTKQDEDIFIVKTQKDGDNWKPERNENITILNNSSIFREDLLNRYFTPTRMLIRQANRIKSALTKNVFSTSYLTFQTSDKLQNLETSGTAQSGSDEYTIIENDNILVSGLANPIYLPMKHKITCMFTNADFETLQANLFGWFDFGLDIKGNSIKGYLIDFEMPTNKDEATITIIEKY